MFKRLYLFVVFSLFFALSAHAGLGVQVNYNHFESPEGDVTFLEGGDFGLGIRSDFGLSTLALVLSFDYYFPEGQIQDVNFYEANANLVFTFPTEGFRPYVGGGVGIARVSFDESFFVDSETQTGVNILGGVKFGGGGLTPFVEGRYVIYDQEEAFANRFVLSGGISF